MNIVVTGGMGYIGSHTVVELLAQGYEVTIIDNLANSKIEVLDKIEIIAKNGQFFCKWTYVIRTRSLLFFPKIK